MPGWHASTFLCLLGVDSSMEGHMTFYSSQRIDGQSSDPKVGDGSTSHHDCRNLTLKECEDDTHILEMGTWEFFGFTFSVCPLVWGWNEVLIFSSNPMRFHKACQNLLVNLGS